ncbi:MAG TPA: hypothetical protein VFA70_12250 [Dehalococcoidia bacterium]|nr:hypothetical protein [Dehalococcoidia bacterium]
MADPSGARLSLIAARLGRGFTVACLGWSGPVERLAPVAQALGDTGVLLVLGGAVDLFAAAARSSALPPLAFIAAVPAALPLLSHALDAVIHSGTLEADTAAELRRALAPGGTLYLLSPRGMADEHALPLLRALGFTLRELGPGVAAATAPA